MGFSMTGQEKFTAK